MSEKITFIIGGARSGKSSFAMKEASKLKGRKAYIATAQAHDEEMKERIEKHKQQRDEGWDTYEEPLNIVSLINNIQHKYNVILIDCLTLWLSNLMHKGVDVSKEIESLISSLVTRHSSLFIVSNEVGMGIVPENKLAREFRDLAGFLNQRMAEIADEVYLVAAGIPVRIK
ncbi:MAG: bifunctional adenosylcobinamide kinase/adenosylcobinamide-phosphate guanylyltransferase [Nitrospirae bacterium]|nr:bifunctional adenosylcobinamide kinase/adenosylcobinamide-phosphate guanylyltransferase [Nitrospirota bacterium]